MGGPVDTTPPSLLSTDPAGNSVNFEGDAVIFRFSERVDARSFQTAFSVTPQPQVPPKISARGSRVTVSFPEPLRDSTTFIFTLDTNLRDLHNVALESPITVAVSTGSEIDEARIAGVVVSPRDNRPVGGIDIYAYATSDVFRLGLLERTPDFRTQSGMDGRFELAYLPERSFYVVALEDRNRNRMPDPGEAFAPPPVSLIPAVPVDSAAVDSAVYRFWITQIDTIPPSVQRTRSLSNSRLQIRYSEPVRLAARDVSDWVLEDSLAGDDHTIVAVYRPSHDQWVVELEAEPLPQHSLRLIPAAVSDTAGNPAVTDSLYVTPVARGDTARARFAGFLPDPPFRWQDSVQVLLPDSLPGVRFIVAPDFGQLSSRLRLSDSQGNSIGYQSLSRDGVSVFLLPDRSVTAGETVVVSVESVEHDTLYTRRFERLPESDRGSISGSVSGRELPAIVEAFAGSRTVAARSYRAKPDSTGSFIIDDLPGGAYFLRVFVDRDGNGTWSGGLLQPYIAPEPLRWAPDSLVVRPRWTISPSDTLVVPNPQP